MRLWDFAHNAGTMSGTTEQNKTTAKEWNKKTNHGVVLLMPIVVVINALNAILLGDQWSLILVPTIKWIY